MLVKEASVEESLRAKGYRLTPQRMMVLAAVQASEDHISVEEIYSQVCGRYPHVDISTVYRTLELLERLELVTRADLGEGRVRYHWAEKGRHHHLVCQKCGRIIELDDMALAPLKTNLRKDYSFRANLDHFVIFGRCDACEA